MKKYNELFYKPKVKYSHNKITFYTLCRDCRVVLVPYDRFICYWTMNNSIKYMRLFR